MKIYCIPNIVHLFRRFFFRFPVLAPSFIVHHFFSFASVSKSGYTYLSVYVFFMLIVIWSYYTIVELNFTLSSIKCAIIDPTRAMKWIQCTKKMVSHSNPSLRFETAPFLFICRAIFN